MEGCEIAFRPVLQFPFSGGDFLWLLSFAFLNKFAFPEYFFIFYQSFAMPETGALQVSEG